MIVYLSTLLPLLVIDGVWLLVVAKSFYVTQLGSLLLAHEVIWADVVLYMLYPLGIMLFAVKPALAARSIRDSFTKGALFGLVVYGYYNLTNQAMLEGWPVMMVIVDILWGILVTSLVAGSSYYLSKRCSAWRA